MSGENNRTLHESKGFVNLLGKVLDHPTEKAFELLPRGRCAKLFFRQGGREGEVLGLAAVHVFEKMTVRGVAVKESVIDLQGRSAPLTNVSQSNGGRFP
jgi:hypothetical protein